MTTSDPTTRKFDMLGCGKLKDRVAAFNQKAAQTSDSLSKNPFSDTYQRPDVPELNAPDYGRPTKGSLTEKRGIKAGNHISEQILDLCFIINQCGYERPDGQIIITFGQLFQLYTRISDTVVGMLIRARKYGLVDFQGEMLYQRQDDDKIITLLKPITEIRRMFKESGDPVNCLAIPKK